jgi:hypothetical protein
MPDVDATLLAALVAGAISLCGVVVSALVAIYVAKRSSEAARGTELLRLEHDRFMALVDHVFALDKHIFLTDSVEFPQPDDLEAGLRMLDKIGKEVILVLHHRPALKAAARFDEAARALIASWGDGLLPGGGINAYQLGAAVRYRDASAGFVVGIRQAMRVS